MNTLPFILIKIGVRSEIHDCTIELARLLEDNHFLPNGTFKMLQHDKTLRVDNQYYLKNRPVKLNFEKVRDFVLTIKDKILTISFNEKKTLKELISKSLNS